MITKAENIRLNVCIFTLTESNPTTNVPHNIGNKNMEVAIPNLRKNKFDVNSIQELPILRDNTSVRMSNATKWTYQLLPQSRAISTFLQILTFATVVNLINSENLDQIFLQSVATFSISM